jgi:hyperosmotically inducible protein
MKTKVCALLLMALMMAGLCFAKDAVSDDMIYNNVRIKLAGDQVVKGGALMVDVKDGLVTLSGSVEEPKQKDRAAKLAKSIKGVKQVVNNLTVRKNAGQ